MRVLPQLASFVAATVLLVACSSPAEITSATTGDPGGQGGSGATGAGGDGAGGLDAGSSDGGPIGGDRPVTVYVPAKYNPSEPAPLLVLLHGYTASGVLQDLYFGDLKLKSEQRGFLYAYPDGTTDKGGQKFWNATDGCCNLYGSAVDDSAYLSAVIEDIKSRFNVDPKRVFLLGHSNGGFMSYRMACDHADQIAAIASLAGAMWSDVTKCEPSGPVSVLQIHGTSDAVIAYNGSASPAAPFPSAQVSVEDWAAFDGCSAVADTTQAQRDLEGVIPGSETLVRVYADGCQPGGHAELWTIPGGTHLPSLSPTFTAQVLDFLYAHPKP